MTHILQRIADNPLIVVLLAIAFTISMLLFWRRVRRERNDQRRRREADGG